MKFNNILKLTAVLGAVTLGHKGFNQPIAAALADAPGHVIINEIYGGGGNSKATYKNDFIELYNPTNSIIDLNGWKIQYAPAKTSDWVSTDLEGNFYPKTYYLIQQTSQAAVGANLPTPDVSGNIAMAAGAGKVKLLNGDLTIDFVGYGADASEFEGARALGPSNNAQSISRKEGFIDTNDNGADFTRTTPTPRNSAYVLSQEIEFGIGLNAQGHCEEVFYILETEYNKLSDHIKDGFFVDYPEAYARYQYLAAFVANQRVIYPANQKTESYEKEAVVLIGLTSLSILVGYYVFQTKKSEF